MLECDNTIISDEYIYRKLEVLTGKNLEAVVLALADEGRVARIKFEYMMKENYMCKAAKISFVSNNEEGKIKIKAFFVFNEEYVLNDNINFPVVFAEVYTAALNEAFEDAGLVLEDEDYYEKCFYAKNVYSSVFDKDADANFAIRSRMLIKDEIDWNLLKDVLDSGYNTGFSQLYAPEIYIREIYKLMFVLVQEEVNMNMNKFEVVFNVKARFNVKADCDSEAKYNSFDVLYDDESVSAERLEKEFIKGKLMVEAFFYKNDLDNEFGVESVKVAAFVIAYDKEEAKEKIYSHKSNIENVFEELFNVEVLEITIE